jgi:hypothetical protein
LTCGDAVEPPIGIEPMTYSLRVKAKPSIEVRESLGPAWLGLNDAVSSAQIRVAVSKLLATFRAAPSAELVHDL